MKDKLFFTSEKYKEKALSKKNTQYENDLTPEEAFYLCINGLEYGCLDKLCVELQKNLNDGRSLGTIYLMLQNLDMPLEFKKLVLDLAYKIIDENKTLGSKTTPDGKFNSSSWLSHSLHEGELCYILASNLGLDPSTAMKLGILHDIGRKKIHNFNHTILGYEYLVDLGYEDEAICTLTHSFLPDVRKKEIKGSRCANCDKAIDGLVVDSEMNESFISEEVKDDMTLFLENYNYNLYDVILNISDLMALSSGISSPLDRVLDIQTRKAPDERNHALFLHRFICALNDVLYEVTGEVSYLKTIATLSTDINELQKEFEQTSNKFMEVYNNILTNPESDKKKNLV